MVLQYSPHRSEIIDYLFVPFHLLPWVDDPAERCSPKEREFFREAFTVKDRFLKELAPFQVEVEQSYLSGQIEGILHSLYFYLIQEGREPFTLEETYESILSLSQAEVESVFRFTLSDGKESTGVTLLDLLEQLDKRPEEKWYWAVALRDPLAAVRRAVAVSRKISAVYQPYFEAAQKERETFAASFDLEGLIQKSSQLAPLNEKRNQDCPLIVLSPWHVTFAYSEFGRTEIGLLASAGVDRLLLSAKELDTDNLVSCLKAISDVTRYQVLVELVKPHAKSKIIAKQLGITGAAVSFHTQKLLNSQLLIVNAIDQEVKYSINQQLLEKVLSKLRTDFGLD